ncbi:MAG: carbohydrate ABC transporter substrate-binding protein [Streptomyces sp.]|nr:carbohydrate ABC transporter substrate-binding protein [Streptomyces sp.]
MGRLRYLQSQQQAVVARHSDFGWLLWAEWGAAVVLALATLWRLAEAARFSSARFRRRWSPPLTAGFLLLAGGTATLIAFTALTHAALADTRDLLAPALTGDDITHAGRRVSARLAGTGFRAAAAGWTLAGGLALAALVLLGLQPRINEYRVKVTTLRWPRPRTLAAAGLSLALLAGIGVVAVQATGWRGSVTLLANWTGAQEEKFRSDVIEPFQKDRRIRVIYEGSSAESEVLDADVESGTPPDVAVLPGPGELAGYAAKGLLTSLDDVVGASGFAATWVPKVDGHAYWVPIKADLKSMVWFPAARKDEVAADAKDPADWCLGLADGATSGWPGSDWIEDILLQQSGKDVYQQWASGQLSWTDPRVRRAWTTWAGLVSTGGEKAGPALSTAFADAADGVGANPPACRLEHQSSIVPSLAGWSGTTPSFVPSARVIPGAQGGPERWEVSGDLAAVLHDTPASHELISYLASETGQRAWAGTQSGFSVRSSELARDAQGTSTNARIAQALRDPSAVHCFDASDAMPESVRDEFAGAVLRYLAEPAELDGLLANLDHVRMKARTKGDTGLADVCTGGTG